MANVYTSAPIFIDTDMSTTSYRNQTAVTALTSDPTGFFVQNILITATSGVVGAAGTITVTDGATTPTTLLKIPVATTTPMPIVLNYSTPLQWRDFLVTGVTATGTQLQIWTR